MYLVPHFSFISITENKFDYIYLSRNLTDLVKNNWNLKLKSNKNISNFERDTSNFGVAQSEKKQWMQPLY